MHAWNQSRCVYSTHAYIHVYGVCTVHAYEYNNTHLSMEAMATDESTGVSGIHILITYHTRPFVSVLRCRVNRGRGLGHGGQLGAWFDL